jgi:bis(5'-nucleosidyl)-tetraphosphatase
MYAEREYSSRIKYVRDGYMLQERSAGLVVFRMDGGDVIFLLLHYGRDYWGFPKGNIESGEKEKETAIREAEEETGLSSIRLIDEFEERIEYFYRKRGTTIHKEVSYFLAETTESNVRLSFEHKGYKWLNFNEAVNQMTFDNDKEVLRAAKETIEKSVHIPFH